jgi:D-alanine-D-alanine ligase
MTKIVNLRNKKIRVGIIYGGQSPEHKISIASAQFIIDNVDSTVFQCVPIYIKKNGSWILNPQNNAKKINTLMNNHWNKLFDVVFPVLHGPFGEDGKIQGLFEMFNIPYVGCGVLSSAIGMDKDISKRLVAKNSVPIVPYITIKHNCWVSQKDIYKNLIKKKLGYPIFIKPANAGSSFGASKVLSSKNLMNAIENAFKFDQKLLVEKFIDVREIFIAIMEDTMCDDSLLISVPGEAKNRYGFLSYKAKYSESGHTKLCIPCDLTKKQINRANILAKKIFQLLECHGMARIDFFLDKKTGKFIFNEINTIPGFSLHSIYPKLWEKSGISYKDLLSYLIKLALCRYRRKLYV